MKIGTFSELYFMISANDLMSLIYRAKQCEVMFAENKANQEKIVRMKKEYTDLRACHEKLRKEVIKMPVKWTKPKKAEQPKAAGNKQQADDSKKPPKAEKPPKADKPKAAKPPKGDKPKGEKEAK